MEKQIKYIQEQLKENDNVSIFTGVLTKKQIKTFSKQWKLTFEPFGFTKFEKLFKN